MRLAQGAISLALTCLLLSLTPRGSLSLPSRAFARAPKRSAVADVRFIYHGLTVQAPHHPAISGKVRQQLYSKYFLRTAVQQEASLHFPDGTALHINQRTDLVLSSPHLTLVKTGEVDQILAPGSNHRIQTGSAIATAIGTQFDVQTQEKRLTVKETHKHKTTRKTERRVVTTITVVEGVVEVQNTKGPKQTVEVQAGQKTTVVEGKAPSAPTRADPKSTIKWTSVIPPPPNPGMNIALRGNGGQVVSASSQRPGSEWSAANVIDGRLDRGWAATGVRGQTVILAFRERALYNIEAIIIDPAATGGLGSNTDLRGFLIRVSTDGTGYSDVLRGRVRQSNSLQRFSFPHPVAARYLELIAESNYGSRDTVSVAELEVVGASASAGSGYYQYSFSGLSTSWSYPSSGTAPETLTIAGQGCGTTSVATLTLTGTGTYQGSLADTSPTQLPLGTPFPVYIEVGVDVNFNSYGTTWFVAINGAGSSHPTATLSDQTSGPAADLPDVLITTPSVKVKQTPVSSCP